MDRPAAPMVARHSLANALRRLRQDAGVNLDQAAARLEYSPATLSRIENALKLPKARDIRELCDLYRPADHHEVERLLAALEEARESPWYSEIGDVDDEVARAIDMETSANRIEQYSATLIPGLLQTVGYMKVFIDRAVTAGREGPLERAELDRRVDVRRARQTNLMREGGPVYDVLLDEAALRRRVGTPSVMAEQLDRLLELAEAPRLSIRIVPFEAGAHPGQLGSFTIIHLPVEDVADAVYVDSVGGQTFLDALDEVTRYGRVFSKIAEMALNEADSRSFVASLPRRAA